MTHEDFMREAIALSLQGVEDGQGGPFGAVIVQHGKVIARGVNQVISNCDPTAHAEMVAIRQAAAHLQQFDLSDCILYASTEPCPMCLAAIYWARLGSVYYANSSEDAAAIGFDDALFYRELCLENSQRSMPIKRILQDEAQCAYQAWRDKSDKVLY